MDSQLPQSSGQVQGRGLVSFREWRWVAWLALGMAVLTTLPYFLGGATAGDVWTFSGFITGVEDGHSYIAKMRLGANNEWLFRLLYTTEPHDGAPLIFLPYIVPGWVVGQLFGVEGTGLYEALLTTFHVLRVVFGVVLIFVMYRFIAAFIATPITRLGALLLAVFGGGLGWAVLFVGGLPPEVFIPEWFTLLILFGLPHLALARAAMLGGLLLVIASDERRPLAVLAGLLWIITGLAVPFYLAVIYAVLGAWGLARWAKGWPQFPWGLFWRAVIAAGITLPLFGYYLYVFAANPVFAQWSAQNQLATPPVWHTLLAFGPLLVFAAFSLRWVWSRPRERAMLLLGWVLIVAILIYLPINVQRRLAEGVVMPLAILGAMGLGRIRVWVSDRLEPGVARRIVWIGGGLMLAPSVLLVVAGHYFTVLTPITPVFASNGQVAALNWLHENSDPGEVVLGSFETGNMLPARTHLTPYVGHGPETLNSVAKRDEVEAFFADTLPEDEASALLELADYVVYGPFEREIDEGTAGWTPNAGEVIYDEGEVQIIALTP